MIHIAMHSLPPRRARHRNIAIDEAQLRFRPKNILNYPHHMQVRIEFLQQPFGRQRWHYADVLRCLALIPLLEFLANVDSSVFYDFGIEFIDNLVVNGIFENDEAILVVGVETLLDSFWACGAGVSFFVCQADDDWVCTSLIDLGG